MPKTTIKTDKAKFSYITQPIEKGERKGDLFIRVFANDNFKEPLKIYTYENGANEEKKFHIKLRITGGSNFIQAESTNPEWNNNGNK